MNLLKLGIDESIKITVRFTQLHNLEPLNKIPNYIFL